MRESLPHLRRKLLENEADVTIHSHSSKENVMTQGDKSSYTDKQKRQAEHIEESYEKRGVPEKEAERRAWATENKISGGGKKSGSGKH
jgi:hypothetical protein